MDVSECNRENQNIYITSDEEIKEGDWCIDKHNIVFKQETDKIFTEFTGSKKIILTTDTDLIKDGVQAIDDDFLEWFVKNPSCEEVEVEIESKFDRVDGHYHDVWEIIIPKEEPKQETLEESNETTAIRFLEWYRLKKVIYQFHCYHIPNFNDKNWETTVFQGNNSYLNSHQLFEIFKKENYEK